MLRGKQAVLTPFLSLGITANNLSSSRLPFSQLSTRGLPQKAHLPRDLSALICHFSSSPPWCAGGLPMSGGDRDRLTALSLTLVSFLKMEPTGGDRRR